MAQHYHQPGEAGLGSGAFRADLLAQLEGRRAGPVALEALSLNKGRARWTEAGEDTPEVKSAVDRSSL